MRVILLSLDKKVLLPESSTFRRLEKYSRGIEDLIVFCHSEQRNSQVLSSGNLTVYPFRHPLWLIPFAFLKKISWILRKTENKEIIVSAQDPFELGLIAYASKLLLGTQLHIQDHGNFFISEHWRRENILNRIRYHIGLFIIQRADSIRTVSLAEKNFLLKKYKLSNKNILNFPIFTDQNLFTKEREEIDFQGKYPHFKKYILWMGRMERQKNIPLLLRAFHEVLKKHPYTALILVGRGSQKKSALRTISTLDLADSVFVEDWTDNPFAYFKAADLFVLSSNYEGWGLVIIEAVAASCPVVMTETGCASEFIKNNENGWVSPLGDVQRLSAHINDALSDPQKAKSYAEKAQLQLHSLPNEEQTLKLMEVSWRKAEKQQARKKLCYILPFYDSETDSHYFHLYDFINEAGRYLDIFLIVEKSTSRNIQPFPLVKKIVFQRFHFLPLRILENFWYVVNARILGYKNYYTHYSYIGALTTALVARLTEGKCFYWNCGMMWTFPERINRTILSLVLHSVHYLVTGVHALKEGYSQNFGISQKNILILPNWISLERFEHLPEKSLLRQEFSLPSDKKIVLFVHRLAKRKGAHLILPIAQLFKDKQDILFVVAGRGPLEKEIQREINEKDIENTILLGKVPNHSIPSLLSLADVFLMPSEEEGFPRVLIECMASGLPYVASNVGGVAEISPAAEIPYLCDTGRVDQFANRLMSLLAGENQELRNQLKMHARQFSQKNALTIFIELFRQA